MNFLNQIIQGVLLGGFYALLACGLSFMFGVMRIINLAHGSLAILAAFLLMGFCNYTNLSPFIGLLLVLPVMALLGWALQFTVLDRSLRAGPLIPVLSTFGVAVILDNSMFEVYGANSQSLGPNIGNLAYNSWNLTNTISIAQLDALVFVTAVVVLGGLQIILRYTALGRTIRATASDPAVVDLIGVNARMVYAAAAAMAMVMIGLAGAFLAMRNSFDPYAGGPQLIFAFETIVIGGLGSLWGTLVGGIVLGVAQNIGATISPHGFLIAGHLTFLVVLVARTFGGRIAWRALLPKRAAS
ncbi:MAG: branched-chain amino acid ABC transporter permease [Acidocella sp.]|nr:branched-chain amino acid ABC transporter permease [Acidocella sp.]